MIRKIWQWLARPSRLAWSLVAVFGGVVMAAGLLSVHLALETTGSIEFCTSCHSMTIPYGEYQTTAHYQNASGVRAGCPDCHVPESGIAYYEAKVLASKDLFYWVLGKLATDADYEAHRLEMAETVWAKMKSTDSRECRSCHQVDAVNFALMDPKAAQTMQEGLARGETCIDCHKGIAHKMPDMSAGFKSIWTDLLASSAGLKPTIGGTYYTLATTEFTAQKPAEGVGRAGRILAQTPVEVLEINGDQVKVRFTGWRQENADRVVFARAGKRIFVAALDPAGIELVKLGESSADPETGQIWTDVSLEVWLPTSGLTADGEQLNEYGAELYNATCSACHASPEPEHYVANQWISVMDSMKREFTMETEQYQFLQKYLQLHAPDVVASE